MFLYLNLYFMFCRAPDPYFEWSLIACHTLIHYRCACVYIFGERFVFIFILFILISSKLLELVGMGMGVLASYPTDVYCGCHIFNMVGTYRFQFHSTNQVSYTCCISISTVLYRLIWNMAHIQNKYQYPNGSVYSNKRILYASIRTNKSKWSSCNCVIYIRR